jgi:hypothetical protein
MKKSLKNSHPLTDKKRGSVLGIEFASAIPHREYAESNNPLYTASRRKYLTDAHKSNYKSTGTIRLNGET